MASGIEVTIITTSLGAEKKIAADTWLETLYGKVIYHTALLHTLPGNMLLTVRQKLPACDVVHLNSIFYPPSLLTALMAVWYKKPVIWSPRGELDEKALVYSTWKKKPVLWFISRYLLKRIVFHTTSPEESVRVRTVLGTQAQIVEIPNFMEIPDLVREHSPTPYFLCIGRIHPKKALENLIAALPLSRAFIQSNYSLKIVGDDQNIYGELLKRKVKELALENKVEFTGLVEGEAKQRLYAGAYFSILPSHTENFGNVVIESLAQGTPVIASQGTPWQILETEKAGIWTSNDPDGLAAAMDRALNLSPDNYNGYREKSLAVVKEHFDIKSNVHVWLNTYQAMLNTPPPL